MLNASDFKILIVDDQAKNIQVLANILSKEGYRIEYSTSGKDAIEWVSEEAFNIILLDVMMPEIDGYDTCIEIKKDLKAKDIPVIFLTAKTDQQSIIKGFKSGGVDYITKPFDAEELLVRVSTHVELQSSRRIISNLHKETIDSIRYAKHIQESIIPSREQLKKILPESFLLFQQKDIVGGDFYWIKEKGDNIYLAVGDCTGHGVPGAMMSMIGISGLDRVFDTTQKQTASAILEELKQHLIENSSRNKYAHYDSIDMILCIINKKTRKVQLSSASSQIIIVSQQAKFNQELLTDSKNIKYKLNKTPDNTIEFLKYWGNTIGYNTKEEKLTDIEFNIASTDKIYLFSDGYTDQNGGRKNKKIMRKGLLNIIEDCNQLPFDQQKSKITNSFNEWKGEKEQVDDVILLGFSIE